MKISFITRNLIMLMLLSSIYSVCDIQHYDFVDFDSKDFLRAGCNWFELKGQFYRVKNATDPNKEALDLIKMALSLLGDYREKLIFENMQMLFGRSCEWVAGFSQGAMAHWTPVSKHFSGQILYLECKQMAYVLNSFGSRTLTSDFDFSVYSFVKGPTGSMELVLQGIIDVTDLLSKLAKVISLVDCAKQTMANCLDSNGYPEIMVFYFEYFNGSMLLGDGATDMARYSNEFSSKILRYCVVAPIYYSRIANFEAYNEQITADLIQMMKSCYLSNLDAMIQYRKYVKLPVKHETAERLLDPFDIDLEAKNELVYVEGNEIKEIQQMLNIAKFFQGEHDFTDCIQQVGDPRFFMTKMYNDPDYLVERLMLKKSIRYEVMGQIFYVPNTYSTVKQPISNRILLPFIGACHIWASEAYSTFGALEFVRTEKKLLAKESYANCSTLIESFIENFGMMMYHLVEIEAEHLHATKLKAMQEVSDAYSKYLRRAMISLEINCKNDYGEPIVGFHMKDRSFTKSIVENIIFLFYAEVKKVNTNSLNKKDDYFIIFKTFFGENEISELIEMTRVFFLELHTSVFKNLNIMDLYIDADSIDRRLIIL